MSKIFGVGYIRTGTTTLASCLEELGYTHIKCERGLLKDLRLRNDFSGIYAAAEKYDSCSDWPWFLVYKELDRHFPGSKFILTIRKNPETWLESVKRHSLYTHPVNHCRKLGIGYDYPHRHEKEYMNAYQEHNKAVMDYFKNREKDLLVLNWETSEDWKELCRFLGRDAPDGPIPHENRRKEFRIKWELPVNCWNIFKEKFWKENYGFE